MSKKRALRRYDYEYNKIDNVELETAGTIDLDVEIKLTIGNKPLSLDIQKKFAAEIKDLYKALHAISLEQKQDAYNLEAANQGIQVAATALGRIGNDNISPAASFKEITSFTQRWLMEQRTAHVKKDFGHVFELYIQN